MPGSRLCPVYNTAIRSLAVSDPVSDGITEEGREKKQPWLSGLILQWVCRHLLKRWLLAGNMPPSQERGGHNLIQYGIGTSCGGSIKDAKLYLKYEY